MIRACVLNARDSEGGAARAAYRLHLGLRSLQVDSHLYVQSQKKDGAQIHGPKNKFKEGMASLRPKLDKLPLIFYPGFAKTPWSVGWLPSPCFDKDVLRSFDVVHLNWICDGFLPLSFVTNVEKPIIWTLHDSWPFTGGCHLPYDCKRYHEGCGCCPHLGSKRNQDLSHWTWLKKKRHWANLDLTIISPSQWLADCARKSSLFRERRIEVIPNGLDVQTYQPLDRQFCRKALSLPLDKKLLAFGSMSADRDTNKGYDLLCEALRNFTHRPTELDVELVVFGAEKPEVPVDIGLKIHYLGCLHDDFSLTAVYSAVDGFLLPSRQENLPNVVMEAMACGTPCVAFDVGGLPDMIDHQHNGFLAQPFEIKEFAHGIQWVLEDSDRLAELSKNARLKVEEEYAIEKVAGRYLSLYEELLAR